MSRRPRDYMAEGDEPPMPDDRAACRGCGVRISDMTWEDNHRRCDECLEQEDKELHGEN